MTALLETRFAARVYAVRRDKLRSLEIALRDAGSGAESVGESVLAFLIAMAVDEVRKLLSADLQASEPPW
jgi:hypothetical protein